MSNRENIEKLYSIIQGISVNNGLEIEDLKKALETVLCALIKAESDADDVVEVIDNLISEDSLAALSANQGRVLNENKIDDVTNSGAFVRKNGSWVDLGEVIEPYKDNDAQVKHKYENNPNTNAYTDSEKQKVALLESSKFLGSFDSPEYLFENYPADGTGNKWEAFVGDKTGCRADVCVNDLVHQFAYNGTNKWSDMGQTSADTDPMVKFKYESNPDTNAYTDSDKAKVASLENYDDTALRQKVAEVDSSAVKTTGNQNVKGVKTFDDKTQLSRATQLQDKKTYSSYQDPSLMEVALLDFIMPNQILRLPIEKIEVKGSTSESGEVWDVAPRNYTELNRNRFLRGDIESNINFRITTDNVKRVAIELSSDALVGNNGYAWLNMLMILGNGTRIQSRLTLFTKRDGADWVQYTNDSTLIKPSEFVATVPHPNLQWRGTAATPQHVQRLRIVFDKFQFNDDPQVYQTFALRKLRWHGVYPSIPTREYSIDEELNVGFVGKAQSGVAPTDDKDLTNKAYVDKRFDELMALIQSKG